MTTSLESGIEAAKSGQMEEALAHLKDAIVEEPENANVWVWLSAIIEDEEKQTIFLTKALEIDPGNRPAQRGLAFIERKNIFQPNQVKSFLITPIRSASSKPGAGSRRTLPAKIPFLRLNPQFQCQLLLAARKRMRIKAYLPHPNENHGLIFCCTGLP